MANIIEARVRQKVGTFEEWNNNPLILLDGEVALVRTATGALIQQRVGDGFKTFAELPDNIRYDQSAFISVDSSVKVTGNYTVVGAGSYDGVTVGSGKIAVLYWNGTGWVKNFEGDLPSVEVANEAGQGIDVAISQKFASDTNKKIENAINNIGDRVDITNDSTKIPNSRVDNGILLSNQTGWVVIKVSATKGQVIIFEGFTGASSTSEQKPFNVSFQFSSNDLYTGSVIGVSTVSDTTLTRVESESLEDGYIYINTKTNLINKVYRQISPQPFLYKEDLSITVARQKDLVNSNKNIENISNDVKSLNSNFGEDIYYQPLLNFTTTIVGSFGDYSFSEVPRDVDVNCSFKAQYNGKFTIYAYRGAGDFDLLFDETRDYSNGHDFTINIPSSQNYSYFRFRTYQVGVLINYFNFFKLGLLPESLPMIPEDKLPSNFLNKGDWDGKVISSYGTSITAICNGDYQEPISIVNTKYMTIVGNSLNISKMYCRGVGGTSYNWTEGGGSVTFINPITGNYHSRNDSFNYDNYTGQVPEGTVKIRGCISSWLRITSMFPVDIKDTINLIILDSPGNDIFSEVEPVFVPNSSVDPEWATSTYYNTYKGDYNNTTLKGGIASAVMKIQAWMPNVTICMMTGHQGRGTTGVINTNLVTPDTAKAEIVRYMGKLLGAPIIDIGARSGINSLNRLKYITDSVHPYNADGNKALARVIIGELKTIVPN